MKLITLFILLFLTIKFSYSQIEFSKKGIKRVILTETNQQRLNDGKYYNSIIETYDTSYNENGQEEKTIRTIYENTIPKSKNETIYHYQNNRIIFSLSYIEKDSTSFKTNYYYINGLLVKIYFNYIQNEIEFNFEETYNYNSNNKLSSSNYIYFSKHVDSDKADYITFLNLEEKYDTKERTIEMDWTGSDEKYKHNRFTYKWRKNNLLNFEKEFNKNNKQINKTKYKYTLDYKKNWIVKKELNKTTTNKITYREIEYY